MAWDEKGLIKSARLLRDARNINVVLVDGGMGDMIGLLVSVDFLIRTNRRIRFHVWVPDYLTEFSKHVLPSGSLVRAFSTAETLFNPDFLGLTSEWSTKHTPVRTHPVDYGFHVLADTHIYDLAGKNYLQIRPEKPPEKFELPLNYVCIVATASEPVKAMPAATIAEVSEFARDRGFLPVYLGAERASVGVLNQAVTGKVLGVDFSNGVNLINRTSLMEAAHVIAGARALIGLDGGLVHVAGCTDVEIVAGYTLVDPRHIAPIRKGSQTHKFRVIEPPKTTPNRYFQTYNYFYPEDYRTFPGWESVVATMTPDKFIAALGAIL